MTGAGDHLPDDAEDRQGDDRVVGHGSSRLWAFSGRLDRRAEGAFELVPITARRAGRSLRSRERLVRSEFSATFGSDRPIVVNQPV